VLISDDSPKKLREITSVDVQKLLVIQGIIISSTKPFIKASKLKIKCKDCESIRFIDVNPGQNPFVPTICLGGIRNNKRCSQDSFVAMPDSEVMDVQNLKIQ
jgi:DNA replicative helicase MCM subunit Mcm2 (Cdc46/Mcm family)